MHEYYFKIKKSDIEFECSTTDKIVFEQQFSDWINKIVNGSYAVQTDAVEEKVEETTEEITDKISEESEEPILEPVEENDIQLAEKPIEEVNSEIIEEHVAAEEKNVFIPQNIEESFEETSSNRSGFLNVKAMASINEITTPAFDFADAKENNNTEFNFENALEDSLENPKTEVIEKRDVVFGFQEYLYSYNPQSNIDKLIVTGLYILNIEHKERFTIKQLNAKLVPATGAPVDHRIVNEALKQNLLRIVPDLTGTNEFTEYTLTEEGEQYFID